MANPQNSPPPPNNPPPPNSAAPKGNPPPQTSAAPQSNPAPQSSAAPQGNPPPQSNPAPQTNPPKPKPPEVKVSPPVVAKVEAKAEAAPTTSNETVVAKPAPAAVEALKPQVEKAPATALAIAVEIKSAGAEAFDPAAWSQKSIDLWAENATAVLDFAEKLANAKSIDEVTNLQSRFVSERLDALMRQSNELVTIAQRLFGLSATPFCGTRAA